MKSKVTTICFLAAAGLVVCLIVEHQVSLKLGRENDDLRERLSQMAELIKENRRLVNLAADASGLLSRLNRPADGSLATDEPVEELVRLRGEVETLRQQSKEIETLQASTREARAAAETAAKNASQTANDQGTAIPNGSQLEVLRADYWTDKTNMDVGDELRQRIRGDSLKAIASNNLKGDPDFGQVKHLTVVYRVGGVTMTNEFREGDFVVLPKEPEQ